MHAPRDETAALVAGVLDGSLDLDAFGRWLVTLADLGESAAEIAGVAEALRSRMLPVAHGLPLVADTCGTGGDGSGTFNISTAAAIVAAAAGLPVAKHGNRAVSSRTGSGDVLEALGVAIGAAPETSARSLHEVGICFCLAPVHHPTLARVGPLRKSLGRPTVFNLVGPLCNPAHATVQVIGVGRPAVREAMAEAAFALGARRVLVVSGTINGADGKTFDEVSLFGPTDVIDVSAAGSRRFRWVPEDFGLGARPAISPCWRSTARRRVPPRFARCSAARPARAARSWCSMPPPCSGRRGKPATRRRQRTRPPRRPSRSPRQRRSRGSPPHRVCWSRRLPICGESALLPVQIEQSAPTGCVACLPR